LCANFIAEKLYKNIDSLPSFDDVSIAKKCLETDETFLKHEDYIYNDDGCACIFTLVDLSDPTNIKLINSNIGDSRTVFAKKKLTPLVMKLFHAHLIINLQTLLKKKELKQLVATSRYNESTDNLRSPELLGTGNLKLQQTLQAKRKR